MKSRSILAKSERIDTPTEGAPLVRQGMQDKPPSAHLVLAGRATRTPFAGAANYRKVSGSIEQEPERIGSAEREDMMIRKRLDVQIDVERHEYIKDVSDKTGQTMNNVADELIAIGIAVKRGEVIEQQSLPVIREIVSTELRKQFSLQRVAIQEDMQLEVTNEIKAISRASDNRLAALIVKTLRDANIARRLMYTLLAKAYGSTFAMQAYEDASQKAGRDIANRPSSKEDES